MYSDEFCANSGWARVAMKVALMRGSRFSMALR